MNRAMSSRATLATAVALVLALLLIGPAPSAAAEQPAQPRIVGGTVAPTGAWPSQVGLLYRNQPDNFLAQFCGGTMINASWVLTAAHCIVREGGSIGAGEIDVLVGTQSLATGGSRRGVGAIVVHPQFNGNTFRHDIALLRLADPVPTSIPFQPLVSGSGPATGASVVATGWGATSEGGSFQLDLRQVTLSVVSDTSCRTSYGSTFQADVQMCAAGPRRDSCQGDSGGPLLWQQSGTWVQVGIVSNGIGCAQPAFPGQYSQLSAYPTWIRTWSSYGPHVGALPFVRQMHRDLLGREATGTEVLSGASRLDGGTSAGGYAADLIRNGAYAGRAGGVARLYQATYLRRPDSAGMGYWVNRVHRVLSLKRVADMMAAAPEFTARYGSLNNAQFVTLVYQNVLGRTPATSERDYWAGQLDAGRASRGRVMVGFSESPEYKNRTNAEVAVVTTFFALVRRVPVASEISYWSPRSTTSLASSLIASREYHARF